MINGVSGFSMYTRTPYYYNTGAQRQAVSGVQDAQKAAPQQAGSTQKAAGGVWTAQRTPSLETPVQPVGSVPALSAGEQSSAKLGLPIREGADPAEMSVRMRIQYVDPADLSPQQAVNPAAQEGMSPLAQKAVTPAAQEGGDVPIEENLGAEGAQAAMEEGECQTCKQRKYQDESDDMGVSFQTPTNSAPEQAASAVRGHEMEHVVREQAKAEREDRKVVSQNVTIHTAICPECGKAYVSGGTTRTTTVADNQDSIQQAQQAASAAKQDAERRPFSAVA